MIAFLTMCYAGLVWLIFFKLKLLPWNRVSQVGVVAIGVTGIVALLVAMSLYQPYSTDVRAYRTVIQIVPRVTGRVVEVAASPGQAVEQGAVLFRIDPRPFEYEMQRLKAELEEAEANEALAKAEYERNLRASRTGAVGQSDVDQSRSRYEAGSGSLGSLSAQLKQAELDLVEATVYAPSAGNVATMFLRPGDVASTMVGQPVMSFVTSETVAIAGMYPPNALRHISVGDSVEVALDRHPGEVMTGRVAGILDVTADGQLDPSGDIPDWTTALPTSRYAVRFELDDEFSSYAIPAGVGGAAAIYTDRAKPIRIVRKIIVRMYTWLNYFF